MGARNTYRGIYLFIGLLGLLMQLGVFQGKFHGMALLYYTLMSNIWCLIYFTLRMIYDNKPKLRQSKFASFIMSIHTKYAVTMSITLTFLVFHFILSSGFANELNGFNPHSLNNYILHYIIPLMTIVDFLIFDRNSPKLSWFDPVIWMVIPLAYFLFIVVRAPIAGNIGMTSSPYPYPFIDFTIQPPSSVFLNILVIFVIFLLLGYVLLFLDLISRKISDSLRYK